MKKVQEIEEMQMKILKVITILASGSNRLSDDTLFWAIQDISSINNILDDWKNDTDRCANDSGGAL